MNATKESGVCTLFKELNVISIFNSQISSLFPMSLFPSLDLFRKKQLELITHLSSEPPTKLPTFQEQVDACKRKEQDMEQVIKQMQELNAEM